MLDDLRKNTTDGFDDDDDGIVEVEDADLSGGTFLGMTAVERMLLSILLFLLVSAVGALILLAGGRIAL
jgi:hypothetical protein